MKKSIHARSYYAGNRKTVINTTRKSSEAGSRKRKRKPFTEIDNNGVVNPKQTDDGNLDVCNNNTNPRKKRGIEKSNYKPKNASKMILMSLNQQQERMKNDRFEKAEEMMMEAMSVDLSDTDKEEREQARVTVSITIGKLSEQYGEDAWLKREWKKKIQLFRVALRSEKELRRTIRSGEADLDKLLKMTGPQLNAHVKQMRENVDKTQKSRLITLQ